VTNPESDPLVGRTVGQYQILARIGGGGMGVVYSARAARLGRIVALKFLPPQWSHDSSAKDRFVREAQAASATNHPNICTIHDIETADDGQLFIVMAYYDGETLKKRLESGPLPMDEALDIATQVADGLAKAHAQGVVHRDIKPGNLILTEDGVRILDFGLATFADALRLTAENATLGTMAYMSPEQVRGLQADARTDVWATGVVLYEMLTGHSPFRGSHAEAIGYAVRNEQPTLIRDERPEVPEEVEQLVFRALHKETSVRYASGRELARALRQVRGLSVPPDLRTQPVPPPTAASKSTPRPARLGRRLTVAAVVTLASLATTAWLLWPSPRYAVAVIPVANQTGYSELDAYRLALTAELENQLADAEHIKVLPHARLLEVLRPFREEGRDIASREALHAVGTQTGVRSLIVPTMLRENNGWKLRVEFRSPDTAVNDGLYETPSVMSPLPKDAVYELMGLLPPVVIEHFLVKGPRRSAALAVLAHLVGRGRSLSRTRWQSLDAASSFEQGVDAYEGFEYAAARAAFADAARRDARNPLAKAWQSRAALLMRQDRDAVDAGDAARLLLTVDTPESDRLFVEAAAAEARHDHETAGARYRALVSRHPDEPTWLLELGGFQDREGAALDAVATYHQALELDGDLSRAHLELCRLYSPSRLNEPVLARQHGERLLAQSRRIENRVAETQALWCLSDVLREGADADRLIARQYAEQGLDIMRRLHRPFGIARGENYVASIALLAERDAARAAPLLQRTLDSARGVGFVLLESRALMNLGVAYDMLGQRSKALNAYRDSFKMFEDLRNAQDAARSLANAAAILVDYGEPDEGLRDAQNTVGIFHELGDKNFEAHARRVIGSYYRHAGQHDEAIRHLTLGLAVAEERNIGEQIARLSIELARAHFDVGAYMRARDLLTAASARATGVDGVQAHLELARTYARLGDFAAARAEVGSAAAGITRSADTGSLPLLNLAQGELEYESGRRDDASRYFEEASKAWTESDLPEDASVEAHAYVGWLAVLKGDRARGTTAIVRSLDRARATKRVGLAVRCLTLLSESAVRAGDLDGALARLGGVSEQDLRSVSPELHAQVRYWRGAALLRRNPAQAADEQRTARDLIADWLQTSIASSYRSSVRSRPDLRLISQTPTGR